MQASPRVQGKLQIQLKSEIVGLRWMDVDMLHGRTMLAQTKNGEGRIVYLNKFAESAFASLPFDEHQTNGQTVF